MSLPVLGLNLRILLPWAVVVAALPACDGVITRGMHACHLEPVTSATLASGGLGLDQVERVARPPSGWTEPTGDHQSMRHHRDHGHRRAFTGFGDATAAGCKLNSLNSGGGGGDGSSSQFVMSVNTGHVGSTSIGSPMSYSFSAPGGQNAEVACFSFEGSHMGEQGPMNCLLVSPAQQLSLPLAPSRSLSLYPPRSPLELCGLSPCPPLITVTTNTTTTTADPLIFARLPVLVLGINRHTRHKRRAPALAGTGGIVTSAPPTATVGA